MTLNADQKSDENLMPLCVKLFMISRHYFLSCYTRLDLTTDQYLLNLTIIKTVNI